FFQAEDGIRDYKVTGVQTCALPILPQIFDAKHRKLAYIRNDDRQQHFYHLLCTPPGLFRFGSDALRELSEKVAARGAVFDRENRSEERRVGKEGRGRGWREL